MVDIMGQVKKIWLKHRDYCHPYFIYDLQDIEIILTTLDFSLNF